MMGMFTDPRLPKTLILVSQKLSCFVHIKCFLFSILRTQCSLCLGGDCDNASKGIVGICQSSYEAYLLILVRHSWLKVALVLSQLVLSLLKMEYFFRILIILDQNQIKKH